MRSYAVELAGTFFLALTVCTAVSSGSPLAPVGIGAVLAALVFAGGHVSGAHYNPAVTVALWVRGAVPAREVPPYLGAQLVGAAAAAGVASFLVDAPDEAFAVAGTDLAAAAVAELLLTFLLASVVLHVATARGTEGNSFYGLAIGLTVLAAGVAIGDVSGGVLNPAVGTAAALAGIVSWPPVAAYYVVQLTAGALAGLAFRYTSPADAASPEPARQGSA